MGNHAFLRILMIQAGEWGLCATLIFWSTFFVVGEWARTPFGLYQLDLTATVSIKPGPLNQDVFRIGTYFPLIHLTAKKQQHETWHWIEPKNLWSFFLPSNIVSTKLNPKRWASTTPGFSIPCSPRFQTDLQEIWSWWTNHPGDPRSRVARLDFHHEKSGSIGGSLSGFFIGFMPWFIPWFLQIC